MFSQLILAKSFPAAIRRVLSTARSATARCSSPALDFVVAPLRPLFDDIVGARMSIAADGTYQPAS